jgi:hypothetical protein
MPTRLSDIVVPEVFAEYSSANKIEKDAFINSGVAFSNAAINNLLLSQGGRAINLPYFNPIVASEPTVANDDPNDLLVPGKMSANKDVAMRQPVASAWSSMNLVAELAGKDPIQDLLTKV